MVLVTRFRTFCHLCSDSSLLIVLFTPNMQTLILWLLLLRALVQHIHSHQSDFAPLRSCLCIWECTLPAQSVDVRRYAK